MDHGKDQDEYLFLKRAEDFLAQHIARAKDALPEVVKTPTFSDEADLSVWNDANTLLKIHVFLDIQEQRHGENPKNPCRLIDASDITILEYVKENMLWMYDPCVAIKVGRAIENGDREFISKLSKSITAYSQNVQSAGRLGSIKDFLIELDRLQIVNLRSYQYDLEGIQLPMTDSFIEEQKHKVRILTTDERRENFDKAYAIIMSLLDQPEKIETLSTKYLSNKGKFYAHFVKWFP